MNRQKFIEMKYFETYYYANIVHHIVYDPYPYIRDVASWYDGNEASVFLPPFPKWSRLHGLILHIVETIAHEEINDMSIDGIVNNSSFEVWVDQALKFYGLESPGFRNWLKKKCIDIENLDEDNLMDYHNELFLSGHLEDLFGKIANEVFSLLFLNRRLLARFNSYVSMIVHNIDFDSVPTELRIYLDKNCRVKRVAIPEWVKRAVFFRDRGMCASCNKDLSGIVLSQPNRHYDHIIALANGGINDVTNIQLLCSKCNLDKGKKSIAVSDIYEAWY